MATKPGQDQTRYEVITQEDNESGDMIIPLPMVLLEQLGWKEGDNLEIGFDKDGQIFLKKG